MYVYHIYVSLPLSLPSPLSKKEIKSKKNKTKPHPKKQKQKLSLFSSDWYVLMGHGPAKQKITGSISGQSICLGWGLVSIWGTYPGWGAYERQPINVSLPLFSLNINK